MISSWVKPHVRKASPYTCARDLYQDGVLLDANENPFGAPVTLKGFSLNRYPDPYARKLRKALAKYVGVPSSKIFAGSGSDEVIELLFKVFVGTGDNVVIVEPTYGMYGVAARMAGVEIKTALLTETLSLDEKVVKQSITQKTRLVFVCSPNSPTGNRLETEAILKLAKGLKGLLVVDEAYMEFSNQPSLAKRVRLPRNVVILRTLSKAWGMAGLRVGYAVADPEVVAYLDRVKPPYNLNRVSAALAERALKRPDRMRQSVRRLVAERERLAQALTTRGFQIFPSAANFLLVKKRGAPNLVSKLAKRYRIIIRDVSEKPRLKDCVRISVGTPEENHALLRGLNRL